MFRGFLGGAAVLGLMVGSPALAQNESGNTFLDTVVVTADRSEEQVKSLSVPVTVIEEKDIERTNAQTLPELLKSQGVQITTSGGGPSGSAKIIMRGMSSNINPNSTGNVLVLLDGRRIANNDIGFVPLQNIARVEIIRGSASVQYGSEATGGVVNLISKRGQEQFAAFIEQGFGTWNRAKTQVGFSGMAGKFDFSAGGTWMAHEDVDMGGGEQYPNTSLTKKLLGGVNVGYNFNDLHRLGLVYNYSDGDYGRGGDRQDDGSFPYPKGQAIRGQESWDLSYSGALADSDLNWQARYYGGNVTYQVAEDWEKKYGYYSYKSDFDGASASANWNNGFLHLTGGVDYYDIDYKKYGSTPPISGLENYAVFLLGKISLLDERLFLNAGIRYDWFELQAEDSSGSPTKQLDKNHATPSFGISYLPLDWLKLRANYSTSFKMPEPGSHLGYVSSKSIFISDPNLGPEKSEGWEIGADLAYEGVNLALTYFSIDYEDKIASKNLGKVGSQTLYLYRNLPGTTEYRGLELALDWQMGQTFGWGFDLKPYLTLTRMFRYQNSDTKEYVTRVSELSASFGLVFDDPDWGLTASVDGTYYGDQYYSQTVQFGGATVWDLHLAKRLYDWGDKGRLTLKLDILNLTDKYYETAYTYPEVGQSFMVGLRYDY